jgi:hypothetical protein
VASSDRPSEPEHEGLCVLLSRTGHAARVSGVEGLEDVETTDARLRKAVKSTDRAAGFRLCPAIQRRANELISIRMRRDAMLRLSVAGRAVATLMLLRCATCSKWSTTPKRENEAHSRDVRSGEKWGGSSGKSVWGPPPFWCCAFLFIIFGGPLRGLADGEWVAGRRVGMQFAVRATVWLVGGPLGSHELVRGKNASRACCPWRPVIARCTTREKQCEAV